MLRRFHLVRKEDETGISGTGLVCEGVQLSDRRVVVSWLTSTPTISIYNDTEDMMHLHGHDGRTEIEWID